MDLPSYHILRRAVQQNAAPGRGDQLSEMATRLLSGLTSSGTFFQVEVDRTDDPDGLVIGVCEIGARSCEELVVASIEYVWETQVRYPFWGAHCFLVEESHVEFLGATRPDIRGNYVTVHLVAQRTFVPEPREPS